MANGRQEPSRVQSIERAVALMRSFTEEEPEISLTELSRRSGLHKSTTSRILGTLRDQGLVGQNPQNGKYRLGVGLISLAGVALGRVDVRRAAYDHVDGLADETQETVTVTIHDESECVNVINRSSPKPLRYVNWIGRRTPLHATASGKVLLAWLPDEEIKQTVLFPLHPYTTQTITSPAAIQAELRLTAVRGYALALEEYEEGYSAISVPICDLNSRVVAALSVSGPAFRLPEDQLTGFLPALSRSAAMITAELGVGRPDRR